MADQRGQSSWPCSFVTVSTALSLSLFRPYLLFHIMETGQNWYRWKATIMENPTPSVARILDQNSRRTSGFPGKKSRGFSKGLLGLSFLETSFLVSLLLSHPLLPL